MRCLSCQKDGLNDTAHTCPFCGVSLRALMSDMLPNGSVLRETYKLEYPIGRGAFGITYKARHLTLDQVVAVKEFYPRDHAIRHGVDSSVSATPDQRQVFERNLQRFVAQGRSLAQLAHTNVVRVFDMFNERGTAYLVMELVDGVTLRDVLNQAPNFALPVAQVESVTAQLVAALGAVHESRIYHLDVKPENVLVDDSGRVVLVDFGAARQGFSRLSTQAYTVQYAAPEVVAGDDVGPDSDLFELGMLVYEMLVGERAPCALERLLKKNDWTPDNLPDPWRVLVNSATRMKRSERPISVTSWWQTRSGGSEGQVSAHSISAPSAAAAAPGTIVARPGGDSRELVEAIARAADGDVLQLGGGVFNLDAPLLVTRSLSLVGGSETATQLVYAGPETAVRLEGKAVWRIEGVTFSRQGQAGGHVVEVRGGEAHFERCHFTGARGAVGSVPAAGLRLAGRAQAVVRDCEAARNEAGFSMADRCSVTLEESRAVENGRAGIVFEGYSEGTARGNDASQNGVCGILVGGDAKPILEANRCLSNKHAGILYCDHGGGKAWYNECASNELHGICVTERGGPILDSNTCTANAWAGIAYEGHAGGSARANACRSNAEYGVLSTDHAGPALEENICEANGKAGIAYVDQAAGNCRSNQIIRNQGHGIVVSDSSAVHAVENVCEGNQGCGMAFFGRSGGMVKQNRIHANGESGVSLSEDASPLVEANEISQNEMAGLLLRGRTQARALRNRLLSNLYGAYVDEDAQPVLEGSSCSDNRASGFAFFGNASGVARENELQANMYGIYLDDASSPLLESNRCVGNRDSGIAWFGRSAGLARDNELVANEVFGISVTDDASPEIVANRCHTNKGAGLHLEGNAKGRVAHNMFFQNAHHGIEIAQKAQPSIDGNTLQENALSGIVFTGSARGHAKGNTSTYNLENGIEVRDEARPHLEQNRCTDNGCDGIRYKNQSGGSAVSNKASSNTQYGITVRERAHPRLEGNECEANKESGVGWFGQAGGLAKANRCNMNELHGIFVCEQATPTLEENQCEGNLAIDVMIPMSLAKAKPSS